jgi:hypothetical protein
MYRDSETLKLAAEINDFVRSKTDDPSVAAIALEAARMTCSFVVLPISQERSEYSEAQVSARRAALQRIAEGDPSVPLSMRVAREFGLPF